MLNWVEQRELSGLASDHRIVGKISEPSRVLMDLNNSFNVGCEARTCQCTVQPQAL